MTNTVRGAGVGLVCEICRPWLGRDGRILTVLSWRSLVHEYLVRRGNRGRLGFLALVIGLAGFAGEPIMPVAEGSDLSAPGVLVSERPTAIEPGEYGLAAIAANIDTEALARGAETLVLDLPDGTEVGLEQHRIERRGEGDLAWTGGVAGRNDSSVVLTLKHGSIFGRVLIGQAVYELRTDGQRRLIVEQLDLSRLPQD